MSKTMRIRIILTCVLLQMSTSNGQQTSRTRSAAVSTWVGRKAPIPRTSCNENLEATEDAQTITSPGWPGEYLPRLECYWSISAKAGYQVRLDFVSFYTEACCDHLEIFENSRSRARFRGQVRRIDPIISSSGSLELRFHTDNGGEKPGFELRYRETTQVGPALGPPPMPAPCGFNATATTNSQELNSPGWPFAYAGNLDCEWIITARQGKQVQLDVHFVYTEPCCDVLVVYDGQAEIARIMGSDSPDSSIVSSTGELVLRFVSDFSVQRDGFQATFIETNDEPDLDSVVAAPCGFVANATTSSRTLNSPGFPQVYQPNQNCEWRIYAPPGMQVDLRFSSFDTESCCDYLTISDGDNEVEKLKGDLKGNLRFVSTAGNFVLRFHSDSSLQKPGFEGTFRATNSIEAQQPWVPIRDETGTASTAGPTPEAPCGFYRVARAFSQDLYSPGWPNFYPRGSNCVWRIAAPRGMQVELSITSMDTEPCCDTLTIFDKNLRLLTLRGAQLPSDTIISSHRLLVLLFHSDGAIEKQGFQATYRALNVSGLDQTNGNVVVVQSSVPTTATETTTTQQTTSETTTTTRRITATATSTTTMPPSTGPTEPETSTYGPGDECDFDLTASDTPQRITSPNFPLPYPADMDCRWIIRAPSNYTYIRIDIEEFETEECCDNIGVIDEGALVTTIRGTSIPFVMYRSRGHLLEIHFHSDGDNNAAGFQLRYSISYTRGTRLPPGTETCGFSSIATEQPQFITSPGWPNDYMSSQYCMWHVTAPSGYGISFNFTKFDTESCCDYLEIREGGVVMRKLKGRKMTPSTYETESNNVTLMFHSDATIRKAGFKGSYTLKELGSMQSSGLRCYSGIKLLGSHVHLNEEGESSLCGNNSSCMEVTADGVSDVGVDGEAVTVQISIAQCVPTALCAGMTCGQVQNRVSPLIARDLVNCNVRCCNEDMCNRPSSRSPMLSTNTLAPPQEPQETAGCVREDVNFLPGCTYRELYSQAWLCSTLFFNGYPYLDTAICSTNLQLYRSCLAGVHKRCLSGMKPIFVQQNPGLDENLRLAIMSAFGNLTTVIQPSYEVFCERNENEIENLSGGLFSAIDSISSVNVRFCDLQILNDTRVVLYRQIGRLITADSDDFCPIYTHIYHLALDMVRSCPIGLVDDGTPVTELIRNSNKLMVVLQGLLSQYSIPKCIALEYIENSLDRIHSTVASFVQPDINGCLSYNMDLMFLIDGSGSVGRSEFPEVLEMIKDVVSTLDFLKHKIGVMQYSHWFDDRPLSGQHYLETEIALGQYRSRLRFALAVDAIKHHGYTTYTAHAIEKAMLVDLAMSDRFSHNCTRKVIIVITDGSAVDVRMLPTITQSARALGMTFFAVGIDNYVLRELQIIANGQPGNSERVYTASTFFDLADVTLNLRSDLNAFISEPASPRR